MVFNDSLYVGAVTMKNHAKIAQRICFVTNKADMQYSFSARDIPYEI
jgi:hypothetical protein